MGLNESILAFLDQPENREIDLFTFLYSFARRNGLDPNNRHYNYEKARLFAKVANDQIKLEAVNATDGVILMSFTGLGEARLKTLIKFFAKRGVKIASIDKIREEKWKRTPKITTDPQTGGKKFFDFYLV